MQPTALHYTTQNSALAEALCAVGFKLIDCWNRYTDGKLLSLGCDTVSEAKAKGKPGHLTYVFERADDLDAACAAYDATGAALDKGEPIATKIERADAIVIARTIMRGHTAFRDFWKTRPAMYLDAGEVVTEGSAESGKTVTTSFRVVSDGLSEADKNKIFPQ